MKDSQHKDDYNDYNDKYIKANNERFSTSGLHLASPGKYIKANNERFSTHVRARCRYL